MIKWEWRNYSGNSFDPNP